jgi:hypothetical protein
MLKTTLWDRRLCYSLMMSQARPFKIPSLVVYSLNLLKDINCPKIKFNGSCILFVANFDWIVVNQNNWCPL